MRRGLCLIVGWGLSPLVGAGCAAREVAPPPAAAVVEAPAPPIEPVAEAPAAPPPAPVQLPTRHFCGTWPDRWGPYDEVDLNGDGVAERWYVAPPALAGSNLHFYMIAQACAGGWKLAYGEHHWRLERATTKAGGMPDLIASIEVTGPNGPMLRSWRYRWDGKTWTRGEEITR